MPIRKWFASFKVQLLVTFRRREFLIGFLLILVYTTASFVLETLDFGKLNGDDLSNILGSNSHICIAGNTSLWLIFETVYPFLTVLPCSLSFIDDYKNGSLAITFVRDGRIGYYTAKLASVFIGTALAFAVPLLINFAACNIFFPHSHYTLMGGYQTTSFVETVLRTGHMYTAVSYIRPFTRLFLWNQGIYGLLYVIIFSVFSGLLASLTCALSFCRLRNKIIWFAPVFIVLYAVRYIASSFFDIAVGTPTLEQIEAHEVATDIVFFDVNYMDYITPTPSLPGQSALFIWGSVAAMILVMVLMTRYAVNSELKDLQ